MRPATLAGHVSPSASSGPSLIINRFAFVLPSARCEGGKVTTCVPAGGGGGISQKAWISGLPLSRQNLWVSVWSVAF